MSGEIKKSVENEMSEIRRLTVKAKRTLLDYFGYATWEDARKGLEISKRKKSKGVFRELKTEYNENIKNPRRTQPSSIEEWVTFASGKVTENGPFTLKLKSIQVIGVTKEFEFTSSFILKIG